MIDEAAGGISAVPAGRKSMCGLPGVETPGYYQAPSGARAYAPSKTPERNESIRRRIPCIGVPLTRRVASVRFGDFVPDSHFGRYVVADIGTADPEDNIFAMLVA